MKSLLASIGLVALLTGCAVQVKDSDFLKAQTAEAIAPTAQLPAGYVLQADKVATADGFQLYRARFVHPQARSTVLFFGGNMTTVGKNAVATLNALSGDWHPNVVFADYRGYGQSSGQPSVDALRTDSILIYDLEAALAKVKGQKLVVAGFSLGGMVAGGLLEVRRPSAGMLLATVTNVPDMLDLVVPWYMKAVTRISVDPGLMGLDNVRAVKTFTGPLLVVGAEKDSQTPVEMVKTLYAASASPDRDKQLSIIPGVDHNEMMKAPGFRPSVDRFVQQHGL